jgi:hypothetical protein
LRADRRGRLEHLSALLAAERGGVRLAQVEAQLNAGRRSGLTRHEDLTTYVIVGMNRSWSQRVLDRRWQNALDRAVTGAETLNESLAALARASVKDVQS